MQILTETMNKMFNDKSREEQKIGRYIYDTNNILNQIQTILTNKKGVLVSGIDQLKQIRQDLEDLLKENEENKEKIFTYVQKEEENFKKMAAKSIRLFTDRLTESTCEMVEMYKGSDFKEYIEKQIVRRIKREYENWIVMYVPHVDELIRKMEEELVLGLCYNFNCKINLKQDNGEVFTNENISLNLEVKDISNTDVHAGVIAAASGLGLMLLAGGTLMPFVSFAAMPFLRRKMLEQRLNEVKSEAIPLLQDNIMQISNNLKENIFNYIHDKCSKVELGVGDAYKTALESMRENINDSLEKRAEEDFDLQKRLKNVELEIDNILKFKQTLEKNQ